MSVKHDAAIRAIENLIDDAWDLLNAADGEAVVVKTARGCLDALYGALTSEALRDSVAYREELYWRDVVGG